ncbi:hypothetical protein ACSFA8_18710 [Variovorax sp. RT4R15]|uniref:hypothetical protein n=1 Tax=Variovorax sp. RT4R15 TaxID=3443737 RepID=UPI003F459B61
MNIRHLSIGLLACAALQACTTAAPPAAPPLPPPVSQPAPPPPVPMPPPPPPAVAPPPPPVVEAPRDPAVDPRGLCDGRAEGARAQMTGPRGETIAGVCRRGANGWLQFTPEPRR